MGKRCFIFHLFSWITGIKTIMLLIIVLCLIAKLTLVCCHWAVGTLKLKHFGWTKVGRNVLTCFLLQTAVKFLRALIFNFPPITEISICPITKFAFEQLNDLWIINWWSCERRLSLSNLRNISLIQYEALNNFLQNLTTHTCEKRLLVSSFLFVSLSVQMEWFCLY